MSYFVPSASADSYSRFLQLSTKELKADGKTFMAVAASFVKHLADPAPLKTANIQVGRKEGRKEGREGKAVFWGVIFRSCTLKGGRLNGDGWGECLMENYGDHWLIDIITYLDVDSDGNLLWYESPFCFYVFGIMGTKDFVGVALLTPVFVGYWNHGCMERVSSSDPIEGESSPNWS